MYDNFEWPVPPFYELPLGQDFVGNEPAILFLTAGRKVTGSLTRFLPTHGVVEFLPSRGRANLDIPLADIVQLRLTRPLVFRQRALSIEQRGAEITRPSPQQPFTVELTSGETLAGETVGFEVQSAGLFLYLVNYKDSVLRVFIPAGSVRSRQIGKPIGEILVQEKFVTDNQVQSGLERQRVLRGQKLGDLLAEGQVISGDQLRVALDRQRGMPMMRLGEALISTKMITEAQLQDALELQKQNREKFLGDILLDAGHVTKQDLFRALSQKLGIPSVELKKFDVDPAVLKLLPAAVVNEFNVLPLCFDGKALVVAMSNPLNPIPIERVRFITQLAVTPVIATAEDIAEKIRAHFGPKASERKIEDLATQLSSEAGGKAGASISSTSDRRMWNCGSRSCRRWTAWKTRCCACLPRASLCRSTTSGCGRRCAKRRRHCCRNRTA
jgi:type II secretion system (T2SS) protein E